MAKFIWKFLADVSGVAVTLCWLVLSGPTMLMRIGNYLVSEPLRGAAILGIFLGSLIYVLSLAKRKFLKIRDDVREKRVERSLTAASRSSRNVQELVPETSVLESAYKVAFSRAKRWADDARNDGFQFYLDRYLADGEIETTFQICFYSEWRGESLAVYFPDGAEQRHCRQSRNADSVPFFRVSKWREAVTKAFSKVESKMQGEFRVQVSTWKDQVSIDIGYSVGKTTHDTQFKFTGGKLTSLEDGKIIEV